MNAFSVLITLIISVVVGGIAGGIFGSGGGRGTTAREMWQSFLAGLLPGGIIGAALGVVFSIFSIIQMGISGLLSTLVLMIMCGIIGAAALGVMNVLRTYTVTLLGPRGAGILSGILFGLIIGLFLIFVADPAMGGAFGQYWEAGWEPVSKTLSYGAGELYKWRYCFVADPHCPFFIDWSDANVQSQEEVLQVGVNFKEKQIRNDQINLLAELSVNNPEKYELRLTPKCYLGKTIEKAKLIAVRQMGSYAEGYEFVFPMSSETLSTSLRCAGDVAACRYQTVCLDQKVFLILERPVRLQGTWPIYIGEKYAITGPKQVRTELAFNAPYSVTLYSSNDLPFDSGHKYGYDFSLAIKQRDENTLIKDIESIRLTFPENIIASCDNFEAQGNSLVIGPLDDQWLKMNIQYDSEEKSYVFPCTLIVRDAPITAALAPIGIEADYTVTSKFETKITKQPQVA